MLRRPSVPLLGSLVAVLAAGAFAAAPASTTGPTLDREAGGWRVEWAGRVRAFDAGPGTRLERVVVLPGGWLAAGTRASGARVERALLAGDGARVRELPAPAGASGAVRERPCPVAGGGGLEGLAWLEGDARESYAVRWAAWNGAGFEPAIEVAPPGAGSQLALAAARLGDGRALLVWSGYDGQDDEIWASVGRGDTFSKPARVGSDDAVPDVTPDVAAVPDGALVAWSRFDGEGYRVTLARFDGARFARLPAEGPPGSLFPTFVAGGEHPLLLWRDAAADDWVAAELLASGELVERARAAGRPDQRPALAVSGSRALFRFPDRTVEVGWR